MHELPVTEDILGIVLRYARRHKVVQVKTVYLEVGALSDLEAEWIQHYFRSLAKGTVAAEAVIEVRSIPCAFACTSCLFEFAADISVDHKPVCPMCGSAELSMIRGAEYTVRSMEAL